MLICVRKQGQEARPLDRDRQLALVNSTGARYSAWHDLPGFRDVLAQGLEILVIDLFDPLRSKLTVLSTSEKSTHVTTLAK